MWFKYQFSLSLFGVISRDSDVVKMNLFLSKRKRCKVRDILIMVTEFNETSTIISTSFICHFMENTRRHVPYASISHSTWNIFDNFCRWQQAFLYLLKLYLRKRNTNRNVPFILLLSSTSTSTYYKSKQTFLWSLNFKHLSFSFLKATLHLAAKPFFFQLEIAAVQTIHVSTSTTSRGERSISSTSWSINLS